MLKFLFQMVFSQLIIDKDVEFGYFRGVSSTLLKPPSNDDGQSTSNR